MASLHEQTGLMLSIFQPSIMGGAWLFNLTHALSGWQHTSQADAGFATARASISGKQTDLEDWIENGLGRQARLYNPDMRVCWQGFVNALTVNLGGLSYKVGPLISVGNYVANVYSTMDTAVTPPAVGMRARTAWYSDTASITRFGRLEKILSSGGATAANAAQIAQMFLAENAWPDSSQSLALGGGSAPALSLELLGNISWANTYYYNSTSTGTTTSLARIQAALAASPNYVYSTDYAEMDANATVIAAYENDDKRALEIIKAAVAPGDPSDYARYTFGIYEDGLAFYKKQPSVVEYIFRLSDNGQSVEDPGGGRVAPWDVRPAKWLFVPDFLPGRVDMEAALRDDPRNIFIESVNFTAPHNLSITGGKVSSLTQALARLGLAGIGA